MPVVVKTRAYDQQFYQEIGVQDWSEMSDDKLLVAAENAKADLGF
jgi:hypothetical protein